jgi:hypothetical protein
MKDNLTNEVDKNNNNSHTNNNMVDKANFAKRGLLHNGHSAFERRHHSADSFQQQTKLSPKTGFKASTTSTTPQAGDHSPGKVKAPNNNNNPAGHNSCGKASKANSKQSLASVDYEGQFDDPVDQSARALLLLGEKENDKRAETHCKASEPASEFREQQNGVDEVDEEEEEPNENLMNESEQDLSEVSAAGGNYVHDGLDEHGDDTEHHLSKL